MVEQGFVPHAVYTQPDRAQGRGRKVKPNAVKQLAEKLDIPVMQPRSLRNKEVQDALASLQPDVLVVAAYGLILPAEILATPTYGCLNVHASLLPRWRGAAPIERAMMAGDLETGICIMDMQEGLDTGPVYVSTHIPIEAHMTGGQLEEALADLGAEKLVEVLTQLAAAHRGEADRPTATPQNDEQATYASKLSTDDRLIDWEKPADMLARQINALANRLPVRVQIQDCSVQLLHAHCIEQHTPGDGDSSVGTVIDASKSGVVVQCASDLLQITSLKVERGKGKVIDAAAAVNGFSDLFHIGARLV